MARMEPLDPNLTQAERSSWTPAEPVGVRRTRGHVFCSCLAAPAHGVRGLVKCDRFIRACRTCVIRTSTPVERPAEAASAQAMEFAGGIGGNKVLLHVPDGERA